MDPAEATVEDALRVLRAFSGDPITPAQEREMLASLLDTFQQWAREGTADQYMLHPEVLPEVIGILKTRLKQAKDRQRFGGLG